MTPDPVARFRSWMRSAVKAGAPMADAMVLATADGRGRPSARYVLLKEATSRGFVFYTNANSRKGAEMKANDHVALVFYWDVTGRQVRIEGRVKELGVVEADAYWEQRPPGSRFASAASEQSRPIDSRAVLLRRYAKLMKAHPAGDVARPAHWKGYLVVPDAIEFWIRAEPRLHKRELFTRSGVRARRTSANGRRDGTAWKRVILQP